MHLSANERSNLLALLLSPDDNNTILALEILPAKDFPRELLTEVFVIYKLTTNESIRHRAHAYLQHHPFMGLVRVMNSNLQLGRNTYLQPTEQTIKKNINTYVTLSNGALDGLRFARAMYRKYQLGLKYLLERSPIEERRALLQTFITGTKFKLVGSSLTTIPKDLYYFKNLTSIDLSDNKLKTLPRKIQQFKQLQELRLAHNNLVSLTDGLRELPMLKHLDVSHNKFKTFPTIIPELRQLETLNVAQLDHLLLGETIEMPPEIQQLTQLKELCVSDNTVGYSQGLSLNYSHFPNFTVVRATPDQTLNLAPLALAEYAYRQNGKSEGLLYLFAYSSNKGLLEEIIEDQFYDASTQTLDLKSTMLFRLPMELRLFNTKHLSLSGCYLGTEHYTHGTKHAYRDWALLPPAQIDHVFSALDGLHSIQTANLSRNRLTDLPRALRSWTGLRQLDLSQNVLHKLPDDWEAYPDLEVLDLSNNQLTHLPDSIQALQSLRVLYLNNNLLEALPAVLGHLSQLEELYLVNTLQADSHRDTPFAIPSEWAGLRSLKKIHLYEPNIQKKQDFYLPLLQHLLPEECVVHLDYA